MQDLFSPIGDKLICLPVDQEEMSSGGIYLPDVDDKKSLKARVVATGKGFWAGTDMFIATTLKPGDVILYQRFSAQTIEYDGEEYHVIQERDVISKLNEKDGEK
uniref:Co-chaperonin GroES n=1 Tax=uncultured virus TaxID=340016 RepID=A0A221S304_9VIRU|nr:co-chaperonin GroES [uncultured virus]